MVCCSPTPSFATATAPPFYSTLLRPAGRISADKLLFVSLHSSPHQRQMGPANVTHVRSPSDRLRRCELLRTRDISQMRAEPTELLGLNLGDLVCRLLLEKKYS